MMDPRNTRWNRRQVLKRLAATSAALMLSGNAGATNPSPTLDGQGEIEIQISSVSEQTLRLSIVSVTKGEAGSIPFNGALVRTGWGTPITRLRSGALAQSIKVGNLTLGFSPDPFSVTVETAGGEALQTLTWDRQSGVVGFVTGNSPLLGLGEGGPQFDRRGSTDSMFPARGGYRTVPPG